MKNIFIILLILISGAVKAQQVIGIPIPSLPTQIGKPPTAWVPISKNNVTYKIDINDITANKLDSAFVRGDSLFTVKNGVYSKGQKIGTGGGTTEVISQANSYEDAFTGASNSYNTSHVPIAGTTKIFINGVKIPPESYSVSNNNVLINTSTLSFTLSNQDRIDIAYQSTFQSGIQ